MFFIKNNNNGSKGFTLIELSIVLVIIGLIIGGILVGQELIHGAQVRASIAQIYKYNSAVTTFQMKYNALPGDFSAASTYLPSVGSTSNGDGNGLIGSVAGSAPGGGSSAAAITGSGEYSQFWSQLSSLSLVDGSYTGVAGGTAMALASNFPVTKASASAGVFVFGNANDNNNYYALGVSAYDGTTNATVNKFLSPEDARNIDAKMDDGVPSTGLVVARNSGGIDIEPSVSGNASLDSTHTTGCVVAATSGSSATYYNTAASTASVQCALRIRVN